MTDPLSIPDDSYELGIVPFCAGWIGKESKRRRCGIPVPENGGYCISHGGMAVIEQKQVFLQRKKLENDVLPLATARVLEILNNPEAKDADVVKIWQTTMDRIGLAAVQGLMVEGNINIEAPLDILRRMLQGDVVDGEVVDP